VAFLEPLKFVPKAIELGLIMSSLAAQDLAAIDESYWESARYEPKLIFRRRPSQRIGSKENQFN
jgi:hypothetical protein